MDTDQTAPQELYDLGPTGAVLSGSTLFVCEVSNILVDGKKNTFCDYVL